MVMFCIAGAFTGLYGFVQSMQRDDYLFAFINIIATVGCLCMVIRFAVQ